KSKPTKDKSVTGRTLADAGKQYSLDGFNAQDFQPATLEKHYKTENLSSVPRQKMSDRVETVAEVVEEWLYGIDGGLAVLELNNMY
ncbi:hypothetical protein BGZ83_004002, partial [Gryganskiella cystojenkinii]